MTGSVAEGIRSGSEWMKARLRTPFDSTPAAVAMHVLPKPFLHILLFLLAVVLLFGKSNATPTTSADSYPDPWDVSWLPGDQNQVINAINSIVTDPGAGGSPDAGLAGYGSTILYYSLNSIGGNPAGVNPAFALAMFRKEANFAKPGSIAYTQNNPGNLRCAGYGMIDCQNGFAVFASMEDGIKAYFWMLQYQYKPGGGWPSNFNCTDITCIITHYCPSTQCDTQAYIDQVGQWTRDFMSRISGGAGGCCLCSPLNHALSQGRAIGEHTLPLSTIASSSPNATPTTFLTATPSSTPTPTSTRTAAPTSTLTSTSTTTPIDAHVPTATDTATPFPTATATPTSDTSLPHGSLTINGSAGETRSLNVMLDLAAEDAGTGVIEMRFSYDGTEWSEWESYQPMRVWQLPLGDGLYIVYVQFRDAAGNVSDPASATITANPKVEKSSSESYRILSSVVGASGVVGTGDWEKASSNYRVQSTTGQASSVAWSPEFPQSSEPFQLLSGYWGAYGAMPCLLSGDFDRDHDVDVNDLAFLAGKWRMTSDHPEWKNEYDFDGDEKVTVIDLMSLQTHWGETCQE